MRLTKVYVRFYRSFNYDHERKFGRTSEPDPWEFVGEAWYPFRPGPSSLHEPGGSPLGKGSRPRASLAAQKVPARSDHGTTTVHVDNTFVM
jgi:hypothetical protein